MTWGWRDATREARCIWARLSRVRTMGVAAEMSFWMFLSLVPLAAVAAFVGARAAIHDSSLVAPLVASLPPDAVGVVRGELTRVAAWNGGAVAPLGLVVFVWLAATGIHSVFDGFEAQAGFSRPWWSKRLLALGSCVALSVGVAVLAVLGHWLNRLGASSLTLPAWSAAVARFVIAAIVLYGIVAWLYLVGLPRATRASMPLVPGTLVVVALQFALAWGYRTYIAAVGNGGAYQAGLAVIAVTMMTTYLFSLSILCGLEVNRMIGKARKTKAEKTMDREHFTATMTRSDSLYVATCNEVDVAGEGATPDAARASLESALRAHFRDAEAIAPPMRAEQPSIEVHVVGAASADHSGPDGPGDPAHG